MNIDDFNLLSKLIKDRSGLALTKDKAYLLESRLLPVARKFELATLRAAIARAPRTVLLQWTLIEGQNDSDAQAARLAQFCEGLDARVNLIPLNPGPLASQRAPTLERCRAFQKTLADRGVRALLRLPHGREVGGACGQLAGAKRDETAG